MRQKGLFPSEVLTEETLEGIVSPLYPQLWRMIRDPFDDFLIRRVHDPAFRILEEGEAAQWLRPQIVERARQLFDGHPRVKIEKKRHQLFLRFDNRLAITPKKFKLVRKRQGEKEELTFSSYDTQQNMAYWQQETLDGLPNLPRLIVGYQFIGEMTEINIWVAYPYGKRLRECFLMPDQSGVVMGVFRPVPDVAAENEDRGVRVKPKRKDTQEVDDL